jgi:hypothetical protein
LFVQSRPNLHLEGLTVHGLSSKAVVSLLLSPAGTAITLRRTRSTRAAASTGMAPETPLKSNAYSCKSSCAKLIAAILRDSATKASIWRSSSTSVSFESELWNDSFQHMLCEDTELGCIPIQARETIGSLSLSLSLSLSFSYHRTIRIFRKCACCVTHAKSAVFLTRPPSPEAELSAVYSCTYIHTVDYSFHIYSRGKSSPDRLSVSLQRTRCLTSTRSDFPFLFLSHL